MQESIINAIMNFLLVSLPEETLWFFTVLILIKRFDLLDKYMWKNNIKYLIFPIISTSLVINLLRYIIIVPRIFMTLSAILTIYLSIVYILKLPHNNILNEKIPYFKIFFYVILSFAILIIFVESLYSPVLLGVIKISIKQINDTWSMNFLLSIPARLIDFIIIVIILSIQNRKTYTNIIYSIFSEKKISIAIIIFVSILIVFWIILIDVFGNYNIISQFKLSQQIMLNILLLIVPSMLLMLMIYLIILFVEKVNKLEISHRNMFEDFDDDINDY